MQKRTRALSLFSALVILVGLSRIAGAQVDSIPATGGEIKITPIMHASFLIEHGGKVIHVDPAGQKDFSAFPKADLVVVTDVHGDHQSREKIDQVKKNGTIVVAPAAVAATITEAQVIKNGEKKTVAGIEIEAVPMYNLVRGPEQGKLFHDKGRGNGYVLTLGGKRVYIAGDTECIPEMKALRNIDAAFIPMNLPYTMPPGEAAECAKAFAPKIAYPYHHRGSNVQEFADALKSTPGVEVRVRQWY